MTCVSPCSKEKFRLTVTIDNPYSADRYSTPLILAGDHAFDGPKRAHHLLLHLYAGVPDGAFCTEDRALTPT